MNFAELVDEVVTLTNRPDLPGQVKSAIRAATLKAHHTDYYPKDLIETGVQWHTPAFKQSFAYKDFDPLFRNMKYLRKYDGSVSPGVAGDFFELLLPEQVLDNYGRQYQNVMYLAGLQYEINSSTEDKYMLLGYYRQPNTTEAAYESWVAVDHPYCIIYEAAAIVFKQTGFDEQAALFKQMTTDQYSLLQTNNILGGGY